MANDQMIQRLEEQLSEAHANNGALRERVAEADKAVAEANAVAAKGRDASTRLETVSLQLKQAESLTHAAVRKQRDAERKADELLVENEDLREKLERQQADVDQLAELNVRIADAKHVGHLIGGGAQ